MLLLWMLRRSFLEQLIPTFICVIKSFDTVDRSILDRVLSIAMLISNTMLMFGYG